MAMIDLKNFDGLKLPVEFHLLKEKIEHFDVRNEDVWITSYPKSGTTWCQEMVWLIGNDLDYEGAQVGLDHRSPFLELNAFVDEMNRFAKKHEMPILALNIPDCLKLAEKSQGIRYIKSHLPWEFLPRQIIDGTKTPKIIHVMRNPKQVAPSYYHHAAIVFPFFVGSLEEFVGFYIKGDVLYGDYFRTVLSYWKQRHLPNLLILTYEEMHSDIQTVIRKVSDFLGKSYNEEEVKKLAHHLSFDQMKKNVAVNGQRFIQNEELQFIRKGATDSYKQELTPEMINDLEKWVAENIKGTALPYENC